MSNHGWGNNPEPGGGDRKPGNNNQGPPDLEEVWRDFNRRLRGAFGGKSGGKPPAAGGPPPNFLAGGVGIIIFLFFVFWLASGIYIVDESERGIVLRFGRYHETTTAGLRWHWPYPIESKEVVNLSGDRTVEVGYQGNEKNKVLKEALMITNDGNIVSIQFSVQYSLKDPKDFLFNNRSPEETVKQAAETAVREVVGKSKMDYILYESRDQIAINTQKLMQDLLDRYGTGIQIRRVSVISAQTPEQVLAAFDDVTRAGQDKERSENEGKAYANNVIPLAKGTAARLFEEAAGYKQKMIATAEGDASRFKQILVEYNKAPEVMRTRLYLETMQQVYANTSKVMVDAKGQGNLLYLPLDKLMAVGAGSVNIESNGKAPHDGPTATSPQGPVEATGPVDRQNFLQNRERGSR